MGSGSVRGSAVGAASRLAGRLEATLGGGFSWVRLSHQDELVVTEWDFAGSLTPELEVAWALTHWTFRPALNPNAVAAFRDGYLQTAGRWPDLTMASFATAVTSWLNWTYNTICEAIDPADPDRAHFAERESTDLLARPMTCQSLEQLLQTR